MPPERLLTSQELAEILQVPKGTLDRWAYVGNGPRYVRVGKHRRYAPGDVEAWLEANKSKARNAEGEGSPRPSPIRAQQRDSRIRNRSTRHRQSRGVAS